MPWASRRRKAATRSAIAAGSRSTTTCIAACRRGLPSSDRTAFSKLSIRGFNTKLYQSFPIKCFTVPTPNLTLVMEDQKCQTPPIGGVFTLCSKSITNGTFSTKTPYKYSLKYPNVWVSIFRLLKFENPHTPSVCKNKRFQYSEIAEPARKGQRSIRRR
jgi:hypothetical protein